MADLFQYRFSIIQAELIIFSIIFIGLGCALFSLRAQKARDRKIYYEEAQPVLHYAYRRKVGIAYIVMAIIAVAAVFLNPSAGPDHLWPSWGMFLASMNILFSTAVLLTLIYASRNAFRILIMVALLLVALLAVSLLATLTAESLCYIWTAVTAVTLILDIIIYIRSRQRFLRIMFGLIGDEAIDYRMGRMKYMFVPSILLSVWAALACCIPAVACLPAIIVGFSIYYIALNFYCRYHSYDIAVVEEVMIQEFDWKNTSDKHWRKIIREDNI